jgi:hypothetical protein
VRNSAAVRFIRSLIPYQAPDISPYERPLTDAELRRFAAPFTQCRQRAFGLPLVPLAEIIPPLRRHLDRFYRWDAVLLRRLPALRYYAGIRVLEVVK